MDGRKDEPERGGREKKYRFSSYCIIMCQITMLVSFSIWVKHFPGPSYSLPTMILLLVGLTILGTCYVIKWLLRCNKPLKFHLIESYQNEARQRPLDLFKGLDKPVFNYIFQCRSLNFSQFKYPTTVNEQVRLFLKDTERELVKPWYSEISQNPSFLFDTHMLLEEIIFKIIDKLKVVNCKNLILSILMLYLNHLQEYKKSAKKVLKLKMGGDRSQSEQNAQKGNSDGERAEEESGSTEQKQKLEVVDVYRYSHPGSQSDQVLNYYLKKVTKWILQEYAPQEFFVSLQCKILTNILAKKVLRACVTTFEDPTWINIKLTYLLDRSRYDALLDNKVYSVQEKVVEEKSDAKELKPKKPLVITKRYMKSNIFRNNSNLFERTDFNNDNIIKSAKNDLSAKKGKNTGKETLNLGLQCGGNNMNGQGSHISSVLGGIISSTAGPLLPENISVCYQPINKMWQSPVTEKKKDLCESIGIPFGVSVVDGMKIETGHSAKGKRLSRSKSTDTMSPAADINDPIQMKDISIGEELCENVRFTSEDDLTCAEGGDGSSKARSNNNVKKLVKTRSFDSGSIAIENASIDSSFEAEILNSEHASGTLEAKKDTGSVSPVYEEPEDFATTIAKLRSLLQQRESSSTLSDKSVQSIDLQSNNASFAEASDSSAKTHSTDLDNSSFESQAPPSDASNYGRLFTNVSIPKSEIIANNNGSPYILYSIQYDGIYVMKDSNGAEEPELMLQTAVVKRKFQDFLNLHAALEECSHLKSVMKGIKGPCKWLSPPFSGKSDESTALNKKALLEQFLQELCSKSEICASPELHEFLAYGQNENKTFVKKDPESSMKRIDKLLTNKVTDVFNSIKTALPSFDFDSQASIAVSESAKPPQDQKLLPGFLSFGNKSEDFELKLGYVYREPTGETFTDDIRRYFNSKTDGIEDGLDVLDSNDWLTEKRECRPISSEGKCVWRHFQDHMDDDADSLDSWLPVYSVVLDILCELLEESDCWLTKEPVVRLLKILTGHWESEIQEKLSKWDWDQIVGNIIRLLRLIIFQSSSSGSGAEAIDLDPETTGNILRDILINAISCDSDHIIRIFISMDTLSSGINLFVESFQHFRTNRDVVLRLFDILLVQLLSCHHLTSDVT